MQKMLQTSTDVRLSSQMDLPLCRVHGVEEALCADGYEVRGGDGDGVVRMEMVMMELEIYDGHDDVGEGHDYERFFSYFSFS